MSLDREIAFFDDFASHGDYDVLAESTYDRLLSTFAEVVRPVPGQDCIDLGCGTGAFTWRLARTGLVMTGIDISSKSIQRARDRADGATYLVGDVMATGLPAGSFDIAALFGVLHHITAASDRIRALAEARRLLRRGGRVFAFDPSAHSPSMFLYRHPRSPLYSPVGKTANEVLVGPGQLRAELAAAGFRSIRVRGLSGITFRYVKGRFARILLPAYSIYEELLRRSPFENALGTFLVSSAISDESG